MLLITTSFDPKLIIFRRRIGFGPTNLVVGADHGLAEDTVEVGNALLLLALQRQQARSWPSK